MDDASRQTDVPTQVAPVESHPGPAEGTAAGTGAVLAAQSEAKPSAQEQASSEEGGQQGPGGASSLAPAANARSAPSKESSSSNPTFALNSNKDTQMPSASTQGPPVAQSNNSHVSPVAQEGSSDEKLHALPSASAASTSTNKSNAAHQAQEGHSNSSSPALTDRQPPGHSAPAGVKKFSSSLSTNKKFLEKTNTGVDPSKTLGAPRPNSSNAGRSSTSPSPGLPAATPPNAPALLSTNSQGPRLISGKIGQSTGRPGGAPAAPSGPPQGWARPVLASAAQSSSSSSTSPALSAPAPPSLRYSTLVPPSLGRNRSGASPVSASHDVGHGRGPPAPAWGQVPQRPGQESAGAGPRPGQQTPSMDGEFPSVAEAARSSQLKAHAVATAIAAKETQDKQAKEEAAAAAEAYQKHMLEEDDAFRGVHIQGHAHWDEMEDEDFGDVVDFGDGATYTLQVSKQEEDSKKVQDLPANASQAPPSEAKPPPEAPSNRAPPARQEEQSRGQRRAPPPRVPANEFDRGHHNEGRSLFNDRIGKLEPFSRDSGPHPRAGPPPRGAHQSRSLEMPSRPEPRQVLSRPPPSESAPEFPPSPHHPRQHHAVQPPHHQERHEPGQKRPSWSQGQNRPPPPQAWGDPAQQPKPQTDQQPPHRPLPSRYQPQPHQQAQSPKAATEAQSVKSGQPTEAARSPTAPAAAPPTQTQTAPSSTGPSLTKDDLESYHSDMQSAAERARKRRQEEEDARKAEQERLKQERLKALDEKIKASQPVQPPAPAPEVQEAPAPSSAKTSASTGPQTSETTEKRSSTRKDVPSKHATSEADPSPPSKREQQGQRQQPVREKPLADAQAKQQPDQTPANWRDNGPKARSPASKREPLPPQDQAAEAALRQPRSPAARKDRGEDSRPTVPARQTPAEPDRTDREWRRAVPVAKPTKPAREPQPKSPRSPGPSDTAKEVALPQEQQPQQQQETPTLVTSVWPTTALPRQPASPEQSISGASGATMPTADSEDQPHTSPSSQVELSSQPRQVLSHSASDSPALSEDQPKAEDKAADQSAPRVKLSGHQARTSHQHQHSAGKPLQAPSKAGHKSALSSSSFDAALARIKGVMAGSHEQGDRTSPEPQASTSFSPPSQAEVAPRKAPRQATPSKPTLSLEQLDDIMTHFATNSEDRPASPRPVWRVLPKVKISRDPAERSLPPVNDRQQRLLAKADARRDHKLWISSLPRPYFTSFSALFAQRGPMSVKLKPTPKVAEARPIRDPRPGVPNVPGTWRQAAASRANGMISEEAGQPELAATGQDIFAEAVQTPDRTPKIQVVLPTPIGRPSMATPRGRHASAGVKAETNKSLSSRPFTEASEGIDPKAEEFVPRSILGSRAVSADHQTPSLRSTSATPSTKSNTDDQAATLSLVKSVWDQPSPDTEFAAASRPSNSLDGLLMDDFPGAMPTMADLRSEDGMSVPSSRNVSPVSRPAAALPSDAISAIGTGPISVSTGSIATSTSALPQETAPLSQGAASYSRPSSASQPVNTMPLPGARNPAMPNWSPSMQTQPQAAVTGSHQQQQQRMFSPPGGYSNPLSEVNPVFSGGIWMPVRPPSTVSPFASNSPTGMHPSLSYPSSPSPHPHSYPQMPGYSMGSQPRSPVGPSGGYGYHGPGPSQGSPYGSAPELPYGAFSQPNGLSPFPGPVQPSPSGYRGGYRKRW